jgi:hypothetical protein
MIYLRLTIFLRWVAEYLMSAAARFSVVIA